MPSFILNTTSTVARTLSNGDIGLIDTNGALVTSGTAVTMAGGSDLYNLGSIRTTNTASGANAITISGTSADIDNRGSIRGGTGAGSDAIEFNVASRTVTNLDIINSGSIRAFAASGSAINLSTGGTDIANSGTIRSALFNAITINDLTGGGSGTRIINSGTITSDLTGRNAIQIINNDADRLENTGTVNGRVEMGGGNDVVINSGFIDGNLIMGDGDDLIVNTGNIGFQQVDANTSRFFTIIMGAGNDTIDNSGSDVPAFISGGAGDDVYIIGSSNLSIVEENDLTHVDFGGNDRVESTANYILSGLGNNVETLILRGTAFLGEGGSIANTITGNAVANLLRGNDGNDTLTGNEGNDSLVGGNDDDRLFGGQGDDSLTGGAGADVLDGGAGRDSASYAGATAGLRADLQLGATNTGEAAGDTYLLVEDLNGSAHGDLLVGDAGGNRISGDIGNDSLFGRLENDTLLGGLGDDLIAGGAGIDDVSGGLGQDSFVFDSGLGAGQADRILDFVVADDSILLDDAVFTALALGQLAANAFATGTAATLASHRIIHDPATGRVLFDADGAGGAAAVEVATVSLGLLLTSADFLVF